MTTALKKYFSLLFLLFVEYSLIAQDSVIIRYPALSYMQQAEAWLLSNNAAGLLSVPVQKISVTEIFANKDNGGFVNYYQSDNSYEWGANTESYYKLNERVTLYGKLRYANFTGQNMTGSAFINPYDNPFDLSETADSTRGEKNMETFLLIGGVATQLGKGFALGGKVDYRTANYAKYRDLRHTNKLLDLTANIGLSYRIPNASDSWSLVAGGSYIYHRSIEGMEFRVYGVSNKQYYTLINFGGFYGNSELWSSLGSKSYTIDSKPMVNEFNGGALQLDLHLQNGWSVFCEATYLKWTGYYGKKSPGTYVFTNHNGTETDIAATLAYERSDFRHSLLMQFQKEHLENYELISQEDNDTQSNRHNIIYLGKNQMLDRNRTTISATYTGSFGIKDFCPAWQLKAGGNYYSRDQRISLYPYYRLQNIWNYDAYASASRNILQGKNQYDITLGAHYGSGGGTPKDDKTYTPPSEQQKPPKSLDHCLYQEYEYLTAPRFSGNASIGYNRLLTASLLGYVRLRYEYIQAVNISSLNGNMHHSVTLAAGCVF